MDKSKDTSAFRAFGEQPERTEWNSTDGSRKNQPHSSPISAPTRKKTEDRVASTRPIVCFSVNDWDDIPSSKFHIMQHLGKTHTVLYVETLGLRRPQLSSRDARRALNKLTKSLSGLRNVENHVYVWSPLAIPYHGTVLAKWFNSYFIASMVKRYIHILHMINPLIWAYAPNAIDVIDKLPPSATVYHCIDDYAEFTDVPRAAFERMERRMLQKADMTVVSAKKLYETKRPYAKHITYIPHGVNLTEFRACLSATANLTDMDHIKHPIAGFVGRIANWIDLPLIARTARALPGWNFVIVGPSNVDLTVYLTIPNVYFLGKKDFSDVPHYIQRFDVCLMPFVTNTLVASVNPLKLYEYLALGKPVVTVPMPEVADFAHVLTIAEPGEFSKAIETALDTDTEVKQTRRIESVSGRSWDDIADRILGLVT
jgi:glycosyltransferase involved in cell wall biosynthesis